jgi:hypothetical protein
MYTRIKSHKIQLQETERETVLIPFKVNISIEGREGKRKHQMLALNSNTLSSLLGSTYSNVPSGSINGEAAAQSASALASSTLLTRPAPALTSAMQSTS